MRYIFAKLPTYHDSFKPGLIWVRCPGHHGKPCGRPHPEYFGPKDRDETKALLRFLTRVIALSYEVLANNKRAAPRA